MDLDGDGKLSKVELREAISRIACLSTFDGQETLIDFVLETAGDVDKDGQLSIDEIKV